MRALLVALALSAPALAQSTSDEPAAPPAVAEAASGDGAVVGTWALDETDALGYLGELGVEIEAMTCAFRADGTADVAMTVTQDQETSASARTFTFATVDGRIVADNDVMRYEVLEDGRLRMSDARGLVLVFERVGE